MLLRVQPEKRTMPEQEPPKQEPILAYVFARWQAETQDGTLIWMDDTTFQRYICAWLEARGISQPTNEQRDDAHDHCRKLSYWKGCCDPQVHIVSNEKKSLR